MFKFRVGDGGGDEGGDGCESSTTSAAAEATLSVCDATDLTSDFLIETAGEANFDLDEVGVTDFGVNAFDAHISGELAPELEPERGICESVNL